MRRVFWGGLAKVAPDKTSTPQSRKVCRAMVGHGVVLSEFTFAIVPPDCLFNRFPVSVGANMGILK